MPARMYKYEHLPSSNEDGRDSSFDVDGHQNAFEGRLGASIRASRCSSLLSVPIISGLSSLTTLCAVWLFTGTSSLDTCGKQLSTYSPALDAVSYTAASPFTAEIVQTNRWRGGLGHNPRKYDEAWASIGGALPGSRLDYADLEKLGKLMSQSGKPPHKIPEESGGGYPSQLEVFHLLHCLDWLRKGIYYNWDYYKDDPHFAFSALELQSHNDHCIDALRMHLMCAADVTPVTYYDSPYRQAPFGDFGTKHTCRDFDAIVDWAKSSPRAIPLAISYIGNSTLWNAGGVRH